MTGNPKVDRCLEALCEHGCRTVREYIDALRSDSELPEWSELDVAERGMLCQELEAIMSVYGDMCRL